MKRSPDLFDVHYATNDRVEVLVAQSPLGRTIIGVVEGDFQTTAEPTTTLRHRKDQLRYFGYEL